ncbi:Helitron like N domain-containing protein, partial [Aphis craccivora]
ETTKSLENSSDHESEETDDEDTNIEPINPGSIYTMIENYDFVSFAPGEGMKPLSILIDDHAEEKAFPDLFGGHPRTNKSPLKNYSKVVRSELLNVDRRFASDSSNLFFKCKVLVQKLIASNVQIVLRKNKKGNTIANDVANPAVLNKMIDNDQGYRMLHNVQNSPSYLAAMRKNVFAMVYQEGQPTLFLIFSPSESTWTDLLKILFRALFKLIKSKNIIFKEHSVKHFFYRVEYQHRGGPHVHMLLWLDNAPVFNPAKPETFGACVTLINKYITCMVDEGSPAHKYLHKNTHSHTHTCYRTDKDKQMKKCRFNISYPPMNETCILTPLTEDISNLITRKIRILKYEKLLQYLRDFKVSDSSSDPSLEDILQKLSIKDVNEYKSILRTVIRRPTVFLKRTIKQRMVSGFNEELFPLWQSNMNCILYNVHIGRLFLCYVIEYIGKSQRGISKLMRDIVENLKSSTDLSVKEQLKKIASTFFRESGNFSTGSSVHLLSHPDKRTRMLKPMANLAPISPRKKKPANNSSDSDTDIEPDTTYPIDFTLIGKPNKENIMLFLPWRDVKTDLLDINCKQVYETNIDQIKKLYQQFNKVGGTQLDDNEIQIEGEQGRNNNQLVDDEDWVADDVLINDVGDYVENTNTSNVDSPYDDGHPAMKVFVTGPAGAGKSMFVCALAQSVTRIANLRPDIDDMLLPPFANVKLLIIDEISMVGIKTLGYIDQRLRSILRINKPFWDINVKVFGDFFQLTPVLATPLYDSFEEILSKFPSDVEMLSIKSIWETFKFYELTEIMRQNDDK